MVGLLRGLLMKKILIITLMVICMIFNITACGVKSNNTSKSPFDTINNYFQVSAKTKKAAFKKHFLNATEPS